MNRVVIWLSLPVGLLAIVLVYTILLSWVWETGLCGTWLLRLLPAGYCE